MNQQQRAVVRQALEALELTDNDAVYGLYRDEKRQVLDAITALRKLLEQPEPVQEPTRYQEVRDALEMLMRWQVKNVHVWHNSAYDYAAAVLERHDTTPPAQPAAWVGLTDEEKEAIYRQADAENWHDQPLLEAVEAKLRKKNGGAA
jgi:hypothetical protein